MQARVCEGCGALLQSDDPTASGYVPNRVMAGTGRALCRHCHRQRSHATVGAKREEDKMAALRRVLEQADLVVFVVDALDFEGTFSARLAQQCGRSLIIAANKADLLPGKIPRPEALLWLQKRVASAHVPNKGVFLVGALKGIGVAALWDAVKKELSGRGVVAVVGVAGVGKSTLINAWHEHSSRQEAKKRRPRRRARRASAGAQADQLAQKAAGEQHADELHIHEPHVGELHVNELHVEEPPAGKAHVDEPTTHSSPLPLSDEPQAPNGEPRQAVSPPRRRRRRTRQRANGPKPETSEKAAAAKAAPEKAAPEKTADKATEKTAPDKAVTDKATAEKTAPKKAAASDLTAPAPVHRDPVAGSDVPPGKNAQPKQPSNGQKIDRADIKTLEGPAIGGRGQIRALLCAACAQKYAATKPLRSKTLRLKPGQAAILAGLAAVAVVQVAPPEKTAFLLLFTPPSVPVQRARAAVIDQFLKARAGAWHMDACSDCVARLRQGGWEEVELELDQAHDVALHGLGWLSSRQGTVTLRVVVPAGAMATVRPRLMEP